MESDIHNLRIHGDNILECENALKLISSSLNGGHYNLSGGSAYSPIYSFKADTGEDFVVQLFPGYGRWNFSLDEHIVSLGGILREAPDAIITRLEVEGDKLYERLVLAFEFSGALPAGNNAWQRTGRALALAYAGVPYLYFAELGGQELDAKRVIKAARFPNPLVPFAYAVLGMSSNSISLPIYIPSPSSHQNVVEVYKDCFGDKESVEIVRGILLSKDISNVRDRIEKKVSKILEILSSQRKRAGSILQAAEWADFYGQKSGLAKADWLIKKAMPWNKKTGIETTPTFKLLLKSANQVKASAIGSRDMPICIISGKSRSVFSDEIKKIYKDKINASFKNWLSNSTRPLVCVWVAGFKPRGDDSRPDRGLVPMARMIFGFEDIDLLTIVYGPAKKSTWMLLKSNMWKLASTNGLWEAILNLSNGLLVDSVTGTDLDSYGMLIEKNSKKFEKKLLPAASDMPNFGEHDVDSVLHILFSNNVKNGVYESLCNPPGGDWSGIGVLDFSSGREFRWTSLPRVSGLKSKRPDHLIQFKNLNLFLSIESKDGEASLENKIGPRLIDYVRSLFKKAPVSFRDRGVLAWSQYLGVKLSDTSFLSGAAFCYKNVENLKSALVRSKVDIVFGVEFKTGSKLTRIHIVTSEEGKLLIPILAEVSKKLDGLVELIVEI